MAGLVALAPGVGAAPVPPHLASLAGQLYAAAGDRLRAPADPEAADAARRAEEALRAAGVATWSRQPVRLEGAAAQAATALGLDLTSDADRATLARWLTLDDDVLAPTIDRFRIEHGMPPTESELAALVSAVAAARAPASSLARVHDVELDGGVKVTVRWNPASGDLTVRVAADEQPGAPAYQTVLSGRTTAVPDPETGDLRLQLDPASASADVLTAKDLARIRASILGEWREDDGTVHRISAGRESAGDVLPSAAQFAAERDALAAERLSLEDAKEFLWEDPKSGEIVRQQRFRRLGEPYEYRGERYLTADAEARLAELASQIDALEKQIATAKEAPLAKYDPVGVGALDGSRAEPITIEVTLPDGHSYTWDEAYFDGRRIVARRTFRDVRELREELPAAIKRELVASWSPPQWLELEATLDPATGLLHLDGLRWTLHVTWSSSFGDVEVDSIHTPYSRRVSLHRETERTRVAYGASDDALP